MRIGVDYRFLFVGPELITRGICRYTQQQLREVLAVDADNEYVLLCNQGTHLSLIDPAVLAAENVTLRVYRQPRDLPPRPWGAEEDLLRRAEHYQTWVYRQHLDVYHSTTPFLLEVPLLTRFDACPMVSTFYDLIPVLFPQHYLSGLFHTVYMRTVAALIQGADRLLSISDAASADAITHLGVPADRIDRAWPIPDAVFRPLPGHLQAKLLSIMQDRFRLPERYVLTVSHLHYTKNLETLLRAYALLPESLRTALPLVICCHIKDEDRVTLLKLAEEIGVAADVVLSGVVSDEELCALYNGATMVVHPSRYEGFGLPVVEAMRCGTPVITTNASSLPEVAGDAALLVDPENPAAFAEAIVRLAGDPAARAELAARGFARAERFNGAQLAEGTLRCYQRAVAPRPVVDSRPHVAIWTALPPQDSPLAMRGLELLEGLSASCDVEVFVADGALPADSLLAHHAVQHHTAFDRRAAQRPFDGVIYQLGGARHQDHLLAALAAHPGILDLHETWVPVSSPQEVQAGDLDRYTDVVANSQALVVHSEAETFAVGAQYPGSDPWVVPLGVADPYGSDPALRARLARARLGLDPEAFVVCAAGEDAGPAEVSMALSGFTPLARARPDSVLVVVGARLDAGERAVLQGEADAAGLGSRVHVAGPADRAGLERHLIAADVVVLMAPAVGWQPTTTLWRAFASARPVVVTDTAVWRSIPSDACLRLPADPEHGHGPTRVGDALLTLASDPDLRARLSAAARSLFEREGKIDHMTSRYLEVVRRARGERRQAPPAPVPMGTVPAR